MAIQDRRRFKGRSQLDLSDLITGIGDAVDPTTENPYFGAKPGDVPFDKKVDPDAFLKKQHSDQPFKGFSSAKPNLEAAQDKIQLQQKTNADQVRRQQMIAENTAEEARRRELEKQAGLTALLDFKNATGVSDNIPMSAADPVVYNRLFGSRGAGEGIVGSSPRLAATLGGLPFEKDIAAAEGSRHRTEAELGQITAEDNPAIVRDSILAKYRQPTLAADSVEQEIKMRDAQKHGWGNVPIHGLTQTGPHQFISPTPETHGGFQPNKFDAQGNPTGFGYMQPRASLPQMVSQLSDGTLVMPGARSAPVAPPTAMPTAPTLAPGSGPDVFAPPLSLKPSAANPSPIQARGALPSLLNNWNAYVNRGEIEQQSEDETVKQDPFRGGKDWLESVWGGPGYYPDAPIIRHPALPLPKKRLTPSY